ncbi:MAG: YkgJ family cysteine cluster protein [Bacteroidetes bacterium]|nr:MAG: YkgJ family cysteine cluster protein [Bacteroidota bacterium]REK49573.1 MAG: YkgJ family cysteine cluster protein [Bacteroidota bacterium]
MNKQKQMTKSGKRAIPKPIEYLKKTYRKKGKKLTTFLRGLMIRKVRGLDSLSKELHKQAFERIDCLKCANCCTKMSPTYSKTDIKRISKHLGMTYDEYFDKYCYKDESGDIMNKKTPCQFLLKNNKCGIYEVRPSDCKNFPHTQYNDFKLYITSTHKQNIEYCPITLDIVERMHEIVIEKGKKSLSAKDARED